MNNADNVIISIRDKRYDRNMVSVSARYADRTKGKLDIDGSILIPFDGYQSCGLIACLHSGVKKGSSTHGRGLKCQKILNYISIETAKIVIDPSLFIGAESKIKGTHQFDCRTQSASVLSTK